MAQDTFATTSLEFVPCNLDIVLRGQIDRYVALKAFDPLGLGEKEYAKELEDAALAFIDGRRWSLELAEAGLLDVAVFDPRPTGEFFAKAGGAYCYINADKCTNYEGIVAPFGIYVVQVQLGPKYKNIAPRDVRSQLAASKVEQVFTTKEGLTVVALRGHKFLRACYMSLSGSVSEGGVASHLYLQAGVPCLDGIRDNYASPNYGSASRGKIV